jgi:hypothetical protein
MPVTEGRGGPASGGVRGVTVLGPPIGEDRRIGIPELAMTLTILDPITGRLVEIRVPAQPHPQTR